MIALLIGFALNIVLVLLRKITLKLELYLILDTLCNNKLIQLYG